MSKVANFQERMVPNEGDPYWHANHLARYAFVKVAATGKTVLDIGCGEGYGSGILAEVAHNVVAIDINEQAIERACQKYRRPNLEFAVMDSCHLSFPRSSFDLVCSFEVIEHVGKPEQYVSQIRRVLKEEGVFYMSTPNKDRYPLAGLNPFHKKEFVLKELYDLLEPEFKHVDIFGQRCTLKARRLYHSRLAKFIYKIRSKLGIRLRFPTGLRELIERRIAGHSIQDAGVDDFDISQDNMAEAEEFIAVCR